MFRLYLTRLKCLTKNRENLFWTFLFPILLATLFSMAFSNLSSLDSFESIKIGLINNENYEMRDEFKNVLKEVSTSDTSKTKLFDVIESDLESTKTLLDEDKIIGYILPGDDMKLVVKSSGIEQTITKSFIESYEQSFNTIESVMANNPEAYPQVLDDIRNSSTYVKEISLGKNSPDTVLNYYYALLAMASLFGCFWGLNEIVDIQGDLSWKGARINVSPIHKMKLLLCNMLSAFTIHYIGILLLLSYLIFVLKINFGKDLIPVMLTCFVSCMLGISLGAMVSALTKKSVNFKSALLSASVMLSCFLAGLMVSNMKYIVSTKVPILQYVNPAHLVTDALYSLYYYDTFDRFTMNILLILGYTLLFSTITYLSVRRKKYASL